MKLHPDELYLFQIGAEVPRRRDPREHRGEHAVAVARRIRTGTLGINGGNWFAPDSPFGGYRQSGIGREMGLEGFEEYLETKTIGIPA